jgi:hypothetical protein
MRQSSKLVVLLAAAVCVLIVLRTHSTKPTIQEILSDGWQMIPGGTATSCALGEPYHFFARTGFDSRNIILYFQAGGACWSAESCLPNNPLPIYDQTVTPEEFSSYGGIFDFDNPANPVRDYDMIFVPLCTGDAHVGDAQVTYRTAGDRYSVTINHYGARNVNAVLDWLFANYPDPDRVWLIGSSAGSLASMYYFPKVAQRYAAADVSMFGDGYLGVFPTTFDGMQRWNMEANLPTQIPEIARLDRSNFTVAEVMTALTHYFPNRKFALYSHAADVFQLSYYGLTGGDMMHWYLERQKLLDSYAHIPNLRYYVGEGVLHTILAFDEFYHMRVGDVLFREWFTDFLEKRETDNIVCSRGTLFCP